MKLKKEDYGLILRKAESLGFWQLVAMSLHCALKKKDRGKKRIVGKKISILLEENYFI